MLEVLMPVMILAVSECSVLVNSQVASSPSGASTPLGSSLGESASLSHMREKIARMEQDMKVVYAGVAVAKKKGEIAAQAAAYAEGELAEATNMLSCE